METIYCEDGGEYRVYCSVCDALCIERFYKTHINNINKKKMISNKSS